MKKLFPLLLLCSVAFGAVLDVKVLQQVLLSPPTFTDRLVPFESAISGTLASYRSGMGLGTEDAPQFAGLTLTGALAAGANSITGGAISGTTLGASGQITSTSTGALFISTAATTAAKYARFANTGGNTLVGTEDSTGGTLGGTAYATVLSGTAEVDVIVGGAIIHQTTSTGLAVTGNTNSGTTRTTAVNGAAFSGYFASGSNGINLESNDDASGAAFAVFLDSAGGIAGSITRVTTTNAVVYNTTSDGRLKTNIRDFTAADAGRLIDRLQPRWFDWKQDENDTFQTGMAPDVVDSKGKVTAKGMPILTKRKDLDAKLQVKLVADATAQVGFIAQEENAVDPVLARIGAVTVGDSDPVIITKQWQRSDAALVPILVAELKALRARVAALESKQSNQPKP